MMHVMTVSGGEKTLENPEIEMEVSAASLASFATSYFASFCLDARLAFPST
jgi:hypothetical protein